ncbi:MAG: ImmA/IrrE family metallo-endopeptidase [Candidatus Paceibacterota bacterium]
MENEKQKPNVGGARNIARKLLKDSKVLEIPVSLQKVIDYTKSQQNLDVVKYNFGEKISGILVNFDDTSTIGFSTNHSWVRRRFTIAHELGHLYLGHTCEGDKNENKENEANQFAAELLVPLSFIKKDFAKENDLDILAKKYIVSKEVLCIHLIECKII